MVPEKKSVGGHHCGVPSRVIFRLDKRSNLETWPRKIRWNIRVMLVNYPGNGLNLIATVCGENLEEK